MNNQQPQLPHKYHYQQPTTTTTTTTAQLSKTNNDQHHINTTINNHHHHHHHHVTTTTNNQHTLPLHSYHYQQPPQPTHFYCGQSVILTDLKKTETQCYCSTSSPRDFLCGIIFATASAADVAQPAMNIPLSHVLSFPWTVAFSFHLSPPALTWPPL